MTFKLLLPSIPSLWHERVCVHLATTTIIALLMGYLALSLGEI